MSERGNQETKRVANRRAQAEPMAALEQRILMAATDVVVNEIMFNSATSETADEYIELYNKGAAPINLTNWKLASGVDYTFGNTTIAAGGYLVVAANLTRFAQKYPGVSNVVGNWVGTLSNSANTIKLLDNTGQQVDRVDYADDGDWAVRRRGGETPKLVSNLTRSGNTATVSLANHGYVTGDKVAVFGANQVGYGGTYTITKIDNNTFTYTVSGTPATPATGKIYVRRADNNHFGWDWFSPADGFGKSLELINPGLSNNLGQNWGPSVPDDGTPGAANSIASSNIAPLIYDTKQSNVLPKSTDAVVITAHLSDDSPVNQLTAQLFYAVNAGAFNTLTMFDDGAHGDGGANDGIFGATIPAQADRAIVEFYVKATDPQANSRTWPGPTDVTGEQKANALYQVDDTVYSGSQPLFKIIMSAAEQTELATLRSANPDLNSNAQMNGTFINLDGNGTEIRYLTGVRNRGGGSRSFTTPVANYHLDFGYSQTWHNVAKINLNGVYSSDETVASALLARAGVPAQWTTGVQVRVNGSNLATTDNGMYGTYSYVEDEDKELVARHFPLDSQGNYYRGVDSNHLANLAYVDNNASSYAVKYPKQTNIEANDYTDLINLFKALDPTQTPDASFAAAVNANLDVKEWMRYFAINVLLGNGETTLGSGVGDDFALYRGLVDQKFKIVAHDLDTVFNLGDTQVATNRSIFVATNVATIKRLMQFPDFAPIYYQQLKDLIDNVWTTPELTKVIHHAMDGYGAGAQITPFINSAIADATTRASFALSQIPLALNVTTAPAISGGYAKVTNSAQLTAMTLGGQANAITTRSVKVNGVAATYTPWQGAWSITNSGNALNLQNGLNRVLVQAFDGNSKEVNRTFVDVWYTSGAAGTTVSANISANTVWTAAGGPYRISGNIVVNSGATLTIAPGTSVYFGAAGKLTINGTLNAVGTDTQRIRFTRDPAVGSGNWVGIYFANTLTANKLAYSDIEFAGSGGPDTQIASSRADLDHDTWSSPVSGQRMIDVTGASSFSITNSVVTALVGEEPIHFLGSVIAGGQALIQGNIVGTTTGHNDIIDFTGPKRPGPIFQILDNIFTGTGTGGAIADDILDVDGTDTHIEGNVFMNVPSSGINDTNSAISGGLNGTAVSNVVSERNFFYNVDHAFLMKEGNSIVSINDTISHVLTGVFNFDEPGFAASKGAGGWADGDIFYDVPVGTNGAAVIVQNPGTGPFTVRNSISPNGTLIPGSGNINADPRFVNGPKPGPANSHVDPTLLGFASALDANLKASLVPFLTTGVADDLSLASSSPAIGKGPNGKDMGAAVPPGASISGEPGAASPVSSVTLNVGGPAIYAYQYKLDNGPWSAAVSVTNPMTLNATIPPISLTNLSNGTHRVAVVVQNDAGIWQSTNAATLSKVFSVDSAIQGRVRINEVLADNVSALSNSNTYPDAIELYNDGKSAIDLSDYSITDNAASPRRFVFPSGTTLAQGGYLVLYADSASAAPGIHLGFALSSTSGEGVYLYNNLASGGTLVDSVTFGTQLEDKSIGRVGDGTTWALNTPTLGSANVAAPTGDASKLKLNEWLASGIAPFSTDFVELYNPDALPVSLGGLYLSDRTTGDPTKSRVPDLSFIPGKGFLELKADGAPQDGADHLNFQLDHDRSELGLFDANQKLIDFVFYGPQSAGVSEGLSPDGSSTYSFFAQPSPGLSNASTSTTSTTLNVVKVNTTWKYDQTNTYANQNWTLSNFNDAAWQSGPGLVYHEDAALPWAKGTELADASHPYVNTRIPYYFRTVFNIADPSSITSLRLNALIDDGAVFYLNGTEIKRIRMAAGTVTPTTQASANVTDATVVDGEFLIPANLLVAGNNVLAAEVHQNFNGGTTSSDVTFGATLDATQTVIAPPAAPIRVTEIMYNPPGSSAVAGDEYEFLELQNTGSSPVNLTGMHFSAGVEFTFGNLTLAPGAKTVIVKNQAAFLARYGSGINIAGQYNGSLDNSGEGIRLEAANNQIIQDFAYASSWYPSTDGGDDSLTINNASADPGTFSSASSWHASTSALGTPGIDESLSRDAVIVNELLANSPTGPNDWIELKNTTSAPIDISNWYLTDSGTNLLKFRVPANTILPAGGLLSFSENQDFANPLNGPNPFSLSSNGDDIYITSSSAAGISGGFRSAAHFGASSPGVSLGRYVNSAGKVRYVPLVTATRGAVNSAVAVGPVVINELHYHPSGSGDEFIELKNITSATVPLYDPANPNNTWRLTDGVAFTFPTGISLAPGELALVVPTDPATYRAVHAIPANVQIFGPYTGALSNSGEHVELSKPGQPNADLTVPFIKVDEVAYNTSSPWPSAADGSGPSLERYNPNQYGDDASNWRASTVTGGTPGADNSTATPLTAAGEFIHLSANQLLFKFTKNVSGVTASSLTLQNLTTNSSIAPGSIAVSYNSSARIATFTFPGLPLGQLPTGLYRATLLASGVSASGANVSGQLFDGNADGSAGDNYTFDFYHLPGDMNNDGKVNFVDYQAFELKFGKTQAGWADGDFNYDGVVDASDYRIFHSNFGTDLGAPPPLPISVPAPVPVASKPVSQPVNKPVTVTKPPVVVTKPAPVTRPAPVKPVAAKPGATPPAALFNTTTRIASKKDPVWR